MDDPFCISNISFMVAHYIAIIIGFLIIWYLSLYACKRLINGDSVRKFEKRTRVPVLLSLFGILLLHTANAQLPESARSPVTHTATVLLISAFGWWLMVILRTAYRYCVKKLDLEGSEDPGKKSMHTQLELLYRIGTIVIIILTLSSIFLSLPVVNALGWGLLSSAGIAGIVAGIAARPVLSNMLAGIQIAITKPIKMNDVLLVEGEWGRVEKVNMTHVVLRIWDLRRLVLPISYFIEKPFQNWTIESSELLTSFFIYCDYTVPVEAVREKLKEILHSTPLWDRRVCVLQVTDADQKTIQLRPLMSARTSSECWDLKCYVREKLIIFLQTNYPEALPKLRIQTTP